MSFYGAEVIYDGKPSSFYDLRILSFETGGQGESPAGSEIKIFDQYVNRRSKPYYFGNVKHTPLEFDITLGSLNPLIATDRGLIDKLFLGRDTYKTFQIVQDDLANIKFDVLFTNATNIYVGNVCRAIKLHGQCLEPWGNTFPKTLTYTYTTEINKDFIFTFYNDSDDRDYLYPYISFTLSNIGTAFTLTNSTDGSRVFGFGLSGSLLSPNEVITVDNDRQILTSSLGLYRLSRFNKNWFRLLPGANIIRLVGAIKSFIMTYTLARKVGG